MSAFDPDQWLRDFEASGGSFALSPDGRLWLGTVAQPRIKRSRTFDLLCLPERAVAIKEAVRKRCLIA